MTAKLRINQAGLSSGVENVGREDGLATGAKVTVYSLDHNSTYEVELLWVGQHPLPDTTSVATLVDNGNGSFSFNPTAGVYGTWRIKLTTDRGTLLEASVIRSFSIKERASAVRIPAANEQSDPKGSLANPGVGSESNWGDGIVGSPFRLSMFVSWWKSLADVVFRTNSAESTITVGSGFIRILTEQLVIGGAAFSTSSRRKHSFKASCVVSSTEDSVTKVGLYDLGADGHSGLPRLVCELEFDEDGGAASIKSSPLTVVASGSSVSTNDGKIKEGDRTYEVRASLQATAGTAHIVWAGFAVEGT